MTPDPADLLDVELLELAEATLVESGYSVQRTTVEGTEMLLAEDKDSVVILASLLSSEAILEVEPPMTDLLASRFERIAGTPKRWDGYVTIITSAKARADLGEPLYSLAYNLARVRRIIRVSVGATQADVERALAPLLPLSTARDGLPRANALQSLEQRLVADGVAEADVSLAMAEFRAQQSEVDQRIDDLESVTADSAPDDGPHDE